MSENNNMEMEKKNSIKNSSYNHVGFALHCEKTCFNTM